MRTAYDNVNHIGGRLGNHVDSEEAEACEAEDYYPDTTLEPHPRTVVGRGGVVVGAGGGVGVGVVGGAPGAGYVKYNSFANY